MEYSGNSRKTWQIINDLASRKSKSISVREVNLNGNSVANQTNLSNAFNEYFSTKESKLASEIPVSSGHRRNIDYLINTDKRFQFTQTNNDQVLSVLNNLCKSKATGLDQISARLVRECADLIFNSITYIFNLSLTLGIFPDNWKCAKVTPILKQGARNEMNNYPPTFMISIMAKAFEQIIYNQLYAYL